MRKSGGKVEKRAGGVFFVRSWSNHEKPCKTICRLQTMLNRNVHFSLLIRYLFSFASDIVQKYLYGLGIHSASGVSVSAPPQYVCSSAFSRLPLARYDMMQRRTSMSMSCQVPPRSDGTACTVVTLQSRKAICIILSLHHWKAIRSVTLSSPRYPTNQLECYQKTYVGDGVGV